MKEFLSSKEVVVANGGYLFNTATPKAQPVTNEAFVVAQQQAEFVIKFAEMAKGKNFKTVKGVDLSAFTLSVYNSLQEKDAEYVSVPEPKKGKTQVALAKEALQYITDTEGKTTAIKVNAYLQQFNVLRDFEQFGLFFESGISKINKIYTIKEITQAVTDVIDLLD